MTICGHQFHGNDGSDWVLSTSAVFLDESTTASRILQELFKNSCRSECPLPTETPRRCPKTVIASSTARTAPAQNKDGPKETLIVRKIPGISALEDFDESQHLNGCPIKWLYNKRLLDKKKRFRVQRLCSIQPPRKEEVKREKANNLRDRTPVEIKIHKINLTEKYTGNSDDINTETPEHRKDLDARRKQLAAKLNWKLHDESQELPYETLSETGSRHNYFPPRPLLGLKPLLSVLLAPHKTNCCCMVTRPRDTAPKSKRRASLSIRSLDLPLPQPDPEPQPRLRTTNALRWGSKPSVNAKKLQIPNQIIIKLDQKKQDFPSRAQNNPKVTHCNPQVKKASEQRKQPKSLSSLFYELRGKTSQWAGEKEEVIEEMVRDLTTEGQFKLNRILKANVKSSDSVGERRSTFGRKGNFVEEEVGDAEESNLVCEKINFFKKSYPKAMKAQAALRPMASTGLKTIYNSTFYRPLQSPRTHK